jgi:hypothetical protein
LLSPLPLEYNDAVTQHECERDNRKQSEMRILHMGLVLSWDRSEAIGTSCNTCRYRCEENEREREGGLSCLVSTKPGEEYLYELCPRERQYVLHRGKVVSGKKVNQSPKRRSPASDIAWRHI